MAISSKPALNLIVNADDYGYFPCVSLGILQAVRTGAVTATGILANGPQLERQIGWLADCEKLDLGVHLNLTSRLPLSKEMAGKLAGNSFPSAFAMTGQIISGLISRDMVRSEWRSQIEAVLRYGLPLQFLNSHEHIHMLPSLFSLAKELAAEYQIPHLRLTRAEWLPPFGFSGLLRTMLMQGMEWIDRSQAAPNTALFLGLNSSGKLNLSYLRTLFVKLKPGLTYELMCHPGLFDPVEINDPRLLAYHAWEAELALLTSPQLKELYDEFGIRLVNYRA